MAKSKNKGQPMVGGTVIPQQPNKGAGKVKTPGMMIGQQAPEARKAKLTPAVEVAARTSPYVAMMTNPVDNPPALPPIALPARAIPIKLYQEVLLTTDANGSAAIRVAPLVGNLYATATAITGTTITTLTGGTAHSEYTNFNTNFMHYIPLCLEVTFQYAGTATASAGRFYGIVAGGDDQNMANYPREPNGCEALTGNGISCVWYATSPVWNNPTTVAATTPDGAWMDTNMYGGIVGGPPSVSSCVTVGIWFHLAAFPRSGIVGLTPSYAVPDPSAQLMSELLFTDEEGIGKSVVSFNKRREQRKKVKGVLRDVLKVGGRTIGTVFPQMAPLGVAADLIANMLA